MPSADALRGSERTLEIGQPGARVAQQRLTRGCEGDASPGSLQQSSPDDSLQFADGLAERWLRHVETLGGPAEVQLFRGRDEVPEVVEAYAAPLIGRPYHTARKPYWNRSELRPSLRDAVPSRHAAPLLPETLTAPRALLFASSNSGIGRAACRPC